MGHRRFTDFQAYSLAARLADDLHDRVSAWPRFDMWSTGLQLLRAADSVGANIAEASGRWHYRDRQRLLYIARGSLAETAHWIARSQARDLSVPENAGDRLDEIWRTLNGLIRQTKKA